MRDKLSKRIREVAASETVKTMELANKLRSQGQDIISLTGGPDRDTPTVVKEAAKKAIDQNLTRYAPVAGVPELRIAIAEKLKTENRIPVKEENILVTAGSKFAVFLVLQALIEPGDEVLVLDPSWPTYAACATYSGANVVWGKIENLSQSVSKRTKMLIINSPNNPSGYVLTREQLRLIADLAQDNDFVVVTDEIYEKIVYDCEHTSIGSLDGMAERTVTIGGYSKSLCMTGWRLGYLAASADVVQACANLQSNVLTSATTFTQYAVARTMHLVERDIREMVAEYRRRRNFVIPELRKMGFKCGTPQGAFYAWPEVPAPYDGAEMARKLLEDALVATTPGEAFGPKSDRFIRISFGNVSYERTVEAFERMRQLKL